MGHCLQYNKVTRLREKQPWNHKRNESEEFTMKIQYSNKLADRIAYIECQINTLPFVDFSEFADDPDFHFMPVFGDNIVTRLRETTLK